MDNRSRKLSKVMGWYEIHLAKDILVRSSRLICSSDADTARGCRGGDGTQASGGSFTVTGGPYHKTANKVFLFSSNMHFQINQLVYTVEKMGP